MNDPEGNVSISLTPLGGGQEIGANSYLLKIGTRRVLLDCGLDVAEEHHNPLGLPRLELIDHLDAVIISHAHTDHIGSVMMAHTLFPSARIISTPETSALMKVMIRFHSSTRFKRMHESELGVALPPTREWDESFEKNLLVVPFGVKWPLLPGVTLQFFPAGHILGAAHIGLMIGNRRLLYTGDFCLRDQLTIPGSSLLSEGRWDTVISESTYGARERQVAGSVGSVESDIVDLLTSTIQERSVALLPAFALGKAQEVYAILENAREKHWQDLPKERIFVAGFASAFFPVYAHYLRDHGSVRFPSEIPDLPSFNRDDPRELISRLKPGGPAIVVATHGMMLPGTLSNSLGVALMSDPHASIVITGYQSPNSLGRALLDCLDEPETSQRLIVHESIPGGRLRVRAKIGELAISGHATYEELLRTFAHARPNRLVLVHGDPVAVANLAKAASDQLHETSVYGPTNTETISLGSATVSQESIEEWKRIPVHTPKLPSISVEKPAKTVLAVPEKLYIRTESDLEYVESIRGTAARAVRVWIDPNKLKARLIIESSERFPLKLYDQVELLKRQGGDLKVVASHDSSFLQRLPYDRFVESLQPGYYVLRSTALGATVEQEIVVSLDLREYVADWMFDSNGEIREVVPILENHLARFERIELLDRENQPMREIAFNAYPDGTGIRLHLIKGATTAEFCWVSFVFGDGYPPVAEKLWLRRTMPRDEIAIVEPSELPAGSKVGIRIQNKDFSLETLRAESGPTFVVHESRPEASSIVFLEPGNAVISLLVRREDGQYFTKRREVNVTPAVDFGTKLRREIPPRTRTTIIGTLLNSSQWRDFEVLVDATTAEALATGESLSIKFLTPPGPKSLEVRISAYSSIAQTRCVLGNLRVSVGHGEDIDYLSSTLAGLSGTGALVVRKKTGFEKDRLTEIQSIMREWSPVLKSSGSQELRIEFSKPVPLQDEFTSTLPFNDLEFLDLSKFGVILSQRGQRLAEVARPEETIFVRTTPRAIRAFSENQATSLVLFRVSPFLEWRELDTEADGSLSVRSLEPGKYLLGLLQYGKLVWTRALTVPLPGHLEILRTTAKTSLSTSIKPEETAAFLDDFLRKNDGVPPSIIGIGRTGERRIINAINRAEILSRFIREHAGKGVALFVTPSNEVPKYLSDALFKTGSAWVALSYPCPRDSRPVKMEKVLKEVSGPLGEYRGRVIMRRRIPDDEASNWSPQMRVHCPRCSQLLKVDVTAFSTRTYCVCGFETNEVAFSLEELKDEQYRVFVMQYDMFGFLVEHSRDRFGVRLGGALQCERCGFKTPFRTLREVESIAARLQAAKSRELPGDLAYFLKTGWWFIASSGVHPGELTVAIRRGHCPQCCAGHLNMNECPQSPMSSGGMGRSVVILAGIEILAVPDADPYGLAVDPFPGHEFPGLPGVEHPLNKIERMLRQADAWWEGE
jgi:Cft2 family RNA processing exonuclease